MILYFDRGRVINITPDSPGTDWLYRSQINVAKAKGDKNWSCLAEIGIGVNPAVDRLTGNMLFDEKAAGTAHIALGSNKYMGGTIESTIHCDMVIKELSLFIDGKAILNRDGLCLKESDWRENFNQISLADSPLRQAVSVSRNGIQSSNSPEGRLQRVLRPEPGRKSTYFVGDNETAKLAYSLYNNLPADSDWLSISDLAACTGLDIDRCRRVLHVMWSYNLINLT